MFSHSPFFPLPGSVVALPNKLFNPVLSSCIGALVLLLLLLLFLLYKYNQVRFPVQGKGCEGCPASGAHSLCWQPGQGPSSLEGPGKLPPSRPLPPRFHLEFPAAGPSSCTQPSVLKPPLPCSFSLVAHRSVWLLFGARQRCSLCAVSCSWFCSGPHKAMD